MTDYDCPMCGAIVRGDRTLAPTPPDALREVLDFIADWAHDCIGMDLPSSAYGFQEIEKMARAALGEQP